MGKPNLLVQPYKSAIEICRQRFDVVDPARQFCLAKIFLLFKRCPTK
jgi:hypothetical protein